MKALILFALLGLTMLPASATVIYDTSPPNDNSGEITTSRFAADFTFVGTALVDAVAFWYQAGFQSDLSNITWAIYADAGDALGSVLSTGTAVPLTSSDPTAFFASFSIPGISLDAGTYWLELHAGTSLIDDNGTLNVWWAATDVGSTFPALMDSGTNLPATPVNVSGFMNYAFQLEGVGIVSPPPVPEPSTGLLMLVAVTTVGLGLRRSRIA